MSIKPIELKKSISDPKRGNNTLIPLSGLNKWVEPPEAGLDYNMDIITIRLLGYLYNVEGKTQGHTKSQMATALNVWDDLIQQHLNQLNQLGFISTELISFGLDLFGRQKKIRVYHMTELGRFFIHKKESEFPGIWMTQKFNPSSTSDKKQL